ncbi:MAG: VCBS repeat-containing protein [Calditrichae bacterium]|nr:VCBS repeat-containing protein [Calditrichia bacterium]
MKKTYLIISITFILFLIGNLQAFQISFTGQNLGLTGSSFGALESGDFDNDGDLDLLVIGEQDIGTRVGLIYVNTGSGFNAGMSLTLPYALRIADAKWGDYDNDGDLDILVTGQSGGRLTTILKNNAGTFVEEDFSLLNMEDGSVDWGDYDNDGDLDIAVTGRDININRPLKIYENQGGTFVDSGITLDGVESGDIEWVDYDVDGDLDILISGLNGGRRSELYKQEDGVFSFQQSFEGVLNAASDWGDYDQDGDPDLLLCGNNLGQFSGLYKNDAGNLNQVAISILGVEKGDVKWADFDNDGDLDFILNGEGTDADTTLIYENTGAGFTAVDLGLPRLKNSAIAVGDFDNDRDVDFAISGWNSLGNRFTLVFSNNASNANTAPQPPTNLRHSFTPDGVVLAWDRGTDGQTSANGLTYNVRVGSTPGGSDIINANVTNFGKHTLARRGNNESGHMRLISNLPLGTYYWSVQSVDNNYSTSAFAAENSFELKISATFSEIDAGIPGFQNGEMAWGDYDNDGDLDLAITGFDNDASAIRTAIMTNNGGDSFTLLDAGLQNASGGSVDWGDFDRDGDLDLLLSGNLTETLVYRNNNSNFVKVDAGLPGFNNGDALWIDYDNDGDLDIFLAPKGEIYKNTGTGFILDNEASAALQLVTDGDAAIGDYDNDGDKDIIVVGTTGQYYGYLYRNDGGTFTDWGYDFDVTADGQGFGHPNNGMALADVEWADYDNDGDLDFIMSGEGRSNTTDIIRVTVMYENRGPDLNNAGKWLFEQTETTRFENQRMYEGLNRGSLGWADFDRDGRRDFIVAGSQGSTINSTDYRTLIYSNKGSNIFEIDDVTNGPLRGMGNSAIAIGDYDNDNDLDFIEFGYSGTNGGLGYATRLYKNTIFDVDNSAPEAPSNLRFTTAGDTVILEWDAPNDDKTPSAGLTYNVMVGLASRTDNVVPAHADPVSGKLRKVFRGNAESALQYKIVGLPENKTFYWSVQAIDAEYRPSAFATEATFEIVTPFSMIDIGIPAIYNGDIQPGDFNNDGNLDIAAKGFIDVPEGYVYLSFLWENKSNLNFQRVDINNQWNTPGGMDWNDYNLDGTLDLLSSYYIYKDGKSTIDPVIDNPTENEIYFTDYDIDGDPDIFIGDKGAFYRNTGGIFALDESASTAYDSLHNSSSAWADFDNDGDPDFIVDGIRYEYNSRVFRNKNGIFNDIHLDFNATVPGQTLEYNGYIYADVEWCDYDMDGDLDFAICGEGKGILDGNFEADKLITSIYENRGPDPDNQNGWLFRQWEQPGSRTLKGVSNGSLAWGDYDNDGDPDLFVTGLINPDGLMSSFATFVYRNDNGNFFLDENVSMLLPGFGNGSVLRLGDFDNDQDLDFIVGGSVGSDSPFGFDSLDNRYAVRFFENNLPDIPRNTRPNAPVNLQSHFVKDTLVLSWDAGSDNETAAAGLNYNVRIGKNGLLENVVNPLSLPNGRRKVVKLGNAGSKLFYKITNLEPDKEYTWSVQSIDAGWAGSEFSTSATFNTSTSAITVTSPNGGEEVVTGETFNITWNVNGIANVRIDYSTDAGSNWKNIVASTAAGSGQFTWTVPNDLSNQALIRISDATDTDIFDISDNTFVILNRYITIVHPNGGEIFFVDSSYFVDYYTPHESDFRIEFSTNNGQSWTQIGVENSSYGDQSTLWTIPDMESTQCLVKVSDILNSGVQDLSDNVFSIQKNNAPYVTVTSPNGGENWQVGTTKNITWSSNSASDLTIEYSIDGGNNWITENTSVAPGSGSYPWMIPNTPSNNCLVRISQTADSDISDVSNASFSIVGADEPYVNVLSPSGGEKWEIGSTQTIQWESNNVANIKIEISINGGTNYQTIIDAVNSSPSGYQWVVANLYSNQCLIRISNSENSSVNAVSSEYFSITDTTNPQVVIDDPVEDQPMNQSTRVRAFVVDNSTIQSVTLHYRQGAELTFTSVNMTHDTGDRYSADIPGFALGETGVHYFVTALDSYNNRGMSENYSIAVILSQGLPNPSVPPAGTDLSSYRLFSIPVELDNQSPANFITNNNDLGSYDKERFRWYAFNANTQLLNEYPDIGNLTPGRGYLFITRNDVVMSSGLGTTVDVSGPYKLSLPRGWNLIGNPFNFAVDSIYTIPEMDLKIWKYEGDWQLNGNVLRPWTGYAVNLTSAADLYIVPKKSTTLLSKSVYTSHQNTDSEWLIRIKANDGKSSSSFNFAGQLNDASDSQDKYDLQAPPRLPGQLVVSFNKNSFQSADIRSVHEEGNTWDITCFTNPEQESLNLQFSGVQLPENIDVFLVDMDTHASYNLKNKSNLVFATKNLQRKNYVLAVGTREYLNGLDIETDFYPAVFDLKPVFPNPFNPVTQLNFSINENAKIKLEVYNVLGQQVATLINQNMESGSYSAVWDAGNMSSGIYIFKLSAGQKVKIRRGLLIK